MIGATARLTRPAARRTALLRHPSLVPISPRRPLLSLPRQPSPLIRLNSSQSRPPLPGSKTPNKDDRTPHETPSVRQQVSSAWSTPIKWYPIPVALGALVLLAVQYRRQTRSEIEVESQGEGGAVIKRKRADGPWQVRVLGALPLRSLSQLWGYLNSLVLPVWFRPTGFRIYAWIFGCNLDECVPQDLTQYESLGEFFYRELREGARPIADAPLVSPADGRVLHFGEIVGEQVEQVKGITYSLQALLGSEGGAVGDPTTVERLGEPKSEVVDHENFANINDIPYSLSALLGSTPSAQHPPPPEEGDQAPAPKTWYGKLRQRARKYIAFPTSYQMRKVKVADPNLPSAPGEEADASHPQPGGDLAHDTSVAVSLGSSALSKATDRDAKLPTLHPDNRLYFFVVYLAPGDYHRFHSPAPWVVERRRHFTGDLFSVSPYIANRLKDLFVLNERVALLGRWKYGFFSMVPVGATNVGSIRINFDESLRTNTRQMSHPVHTFTEATYSGASKILQGQPLLAGEEMGGFRLGSTIVLVFEAPRDFEFTVRAGDKIKVGQELGRLKEM